MQHDKERVALTSIVASAALTVGKGVVGWTTGSLAILSEAAHSLLDLAATVMTFLAVRISGRPADDEHHYGHGKVESVAALAETALLFFLSAFVVYEAVRRLLAAQEHVVEVTVAAFGVILASIAVDFFRARALTRIAKATSSEALEADALHFSSDMLSSIAVLIGLLGVVLGFPWADAAAAIAVALFVCLAGWRLGWRTVATLTDTAPVGAAQTVTEITEAIPGIVSVERVRARTAGGVMFIELLATVSRTLPLDRVAALKARIESEIHAALPTAELVTTVEPRALDDESVLERVMVIARNRGLAVHHVTVHHVAGQIALSIDLEVDGRLALRAAHDIASGLEDAIASELGAGIEIDTHIEPLQASDQEGEDASAERIATIAAALAEIAAGFGVLRSVHEVRVRRTDDGEIVNFHCFVDPNLTVAEVHDRVDEVERGLRRRFADVKRVIGHAEPASA